MKKLLVMLISIVLLTGCGESQDTLKDFKDTLSKHDTYKLMGKMSLVSNEDEYIYDLEVGVSNNEYYKVTLLNTINDHEQIILKNDDGVYVITPSLNKSFKFMSEWPNNSSQSYILGNLVKDVSNDEDATIKSVKDGYEITSKVNYPNNQKLVKQVIMTDSKFNIKSVQVKDKDDNVIVNVTIGDIDYSPKFASDYFEFKVEEENKSSDCVSECGENTECKNKCNTETTSNIIEEIVYPLYVPNDTYLASKDEVVTDVGNRVILTFSGVDPFILVEEVAGIKDEMEIVPVNGEPIMLGDVVGAISNNSLYWSSNGVDYYLTSNTLDKTEMMTIAESTKNSSTLVASTK